MSDSESMKTQTTTTNHSKDAKTALIAAKAHVELLDRGRETALVITKIDEALLWLSQVKGEFGPANEALRG
jgi:hypothetical protein